MIAGSIAATGLVTAQSEAENQYTGCVTTQNTLTNVAVGSDPADQCKATDTEISWNETGLPGADGLPGANGLPGIQGGPGPPAAKADCSTSPISARARGSRGVPQSPEAFRGQRSQRARTQNNTPSSPRSTDCRRWRSGDARGGFGHWSVEMPSVRLAIWLWDRHDVERRR